MRKMKNNHPHISSNMTLSYYRFITKRCTSLKKICTFFGIYLYRHQNETICLVYNRCV